MSDKNQEPGAEPMPMTLADIRGRVMGIAAMIEDARVRLERANAELGRYKANYFERADFESNMAAGVNCSQLRYLKHLAEQVSTEGFRRLERRAREDPGKADDWGERDGEDW